MKKSFRIAYIAIFASVVIAVLCFQLWKSGAFIFDHSAVITSNSVTWKGKTYSSIGGEYTEDRTIGKGENDWRIVAIKEDPSHRFIVARSFLDQYLFVADDYTVPTSGKLAKAAWNGKYVADADFLDAVSKIQLEKSSSFSYETENISALTDSQHLRALYFAYEDCPVATNFQGYLGKVDGDWVITTQISENVAHDGGAPKSYTVSCYVIPKEYWDVLSKYFS